MAEDANDLMRDVRLARDAFFDWRGGIRTPKLARNAALACLRSAREGIDALIAEIEGMMKI